MLPGVEMAGDSSLLFALVDHDDEGLGESQQLEHILNPSYLAKRNLFQDAGQDRKQNAYWQIARKNSPLNTRPSPPTNDFRTLSVT